jgi:hypothetical protein
LRPAILARRVRSLLTTDQLLDGGIGSPQRQLRHHLTVIRDRQVQSAGQFDKEARAVK